MAEKESLTLDETALTTKRKTNLTTLNPYGLNYQFEISDLLNFIFPNNLQHPLTNARLFIFGLYGPLDADGHLRSGKKGSHVLMDYELEEMCQQIEREDLIQVYMHRPRDMAVLQTHEQDAIINQADGYLKRAKGKAMLPQLSKQEIRELFDDLPRDSEGKISFHDAQLLIQKYREDRVKQYKLVYPNLTNKNKNTLSKSQLLDDNASTDSFQDRVAQMTSNLSMGSLASTSIADSKNLRQKTVGPHIAPATMFQRNRGHNNADLVDVTAKQLSKFGNKIIDIDGKASTAIISNIKLIREIPPNFSNPYEGKRENWNSIAPMKGSGMGSGVQTIASSSTWKRKYTSY